MLTVGTAGVLGDPLGLLAQGGDETELVEDGGRRSCTSRRTSAIAPATSSRRSPSSSVARSGRAASTLRAASAV